MQPASAIPRYAVRVLWSLGTALALLTAGLVIKTQTAPAKHPRPLVEAVVPPDAAATTAPRKLVRVQPLRMHASSEARKCPLDPNGCLAAQAADGRTDTAWCEDVSGPGIGQTLRADLPAELQVRRVDMVLGAMSLGKPGWDEPGRPQVVELTLNGYTQTARLDLERTAALRQSVLLDHAPPTRELTLTMREVMPGRLHEDLTCIAEITVWAE